jgi:hypothetical protein
VAVHLRVLDEADADASEQRVERERDGEREPTEDGNDERAHHEGEMGAFDEEAAARLRTGSGDHSSCLLEDKRRVFLVRPLTHRAVVVTSLLVAE